MLQADTTVYRTSRMTKAQAKLLEPGDKYRLGMYVATTTDKAALGELQEWQEEETGTAVRSNQYFTCSNVRSNHCCM